MTPRLSARVAAMTTLAALASPAGAQAGTAPAVLRLPGSTRALALGDAHVAVADPDAIFYNPASLAGARGLGVSLQRHGATGTLWGASATYAFAPGTVGLGVRVLDFAPPCATCGDAVAPAPRILGQNGGGLASSLEAVLGYGLTVRGLRVGTAGKLVESWLDGARERAGALDLGASHGNNVVRVALAAQNLATSRDIEVAGRAYPLPRRVTLGAATAFPYPIGAYVDLGGAVQVSRLRDGVVVPGGGVEIGVTPLDGYTFQGRVGARRPEEDGANPVTAGLAFVGDRLALEYAWQGFVGAPSAHRVGLRWR